jgi:hypothetical protein
MGGIFLTAHEIRLVLTLDVAVLFLAGIIALGIWMRR